MAHFIQVANLLQDNESLAAKNWEPLLTGNLIWEPPMTKPAAGWPLSWTRLTSSLVVPGFQLFLWLCRGYLHFFCSPSQHFREGGQEMTFMTTQTICLFLPEAYWAVFICSNQCQNSVASMTWLARSFYLCLAPVTSSRGTSHLFLVKVSRPLLLAPSLFVVVFCFVSRPLPLFVL